MQAVRLPFAGNVIPSKSVFGPVESWRKLAHLVFGRGEPAKKCELPGSTWADDEQLQRPDVDLIQTPVKMEKVASSVPLVWLVDMAILKLGIGQIRT